MAIGDKIIYYDKVSSTNQVASDLLASNRAPHGTVISAGFQSNGKGQRENRWFSDALNNMIMSIILIPKMLAPDLQFYISKIVSLAVIDSLSGFSKEFAIKWPNDIYHGGDKIAGILIEHTIIGDKISSSIAGIGLNVNQATFPDELPNPVSLLSITGIRHNIQDIERSVCINLQKWYTLLEDNKKEAIDSCYLNSLYRKGIVSDFISENGSFKGVISGVNEPGQLLISLTNGEVKEFSFKEVELSSQHSPIH